MRLKTAHLVALAKCSNGKKKIGPFRSFPICNNDRIESISNLSEISLDIELWRGLRACAYNRHR